MKVVTQRISCYLAATVLLLAVTPALPAAAKPNIVLILADDLGLGDLGCYGGKAIPTPNIDRLAAEGLRFVNAYSVSAVCAPTRCGLMTGKHMGHATRRANGSKNGLIALRDDEVTVAELLRARGYATGGFGKWGLGNPGTSGVPEKQGFDVFYGYYDQTHAHNYFPAFLVRNSQDVPMPGGNGVHGKPGKGDAYTPDLISAETFKFIEANRDRPFFCYVAWTLPHGNFEIPDASAFADQPWRQPVKNHAAMIARLDTDIGRLMKTLKDLGLDEKTLVIFTSDNGADGPGRATFNGTAGLRGFKRHLYEGGIRAPFIARWPGVTKPGTSDLVCGHVDFLATACDLAGMSAREDTDGFSLVATLRGLPQTARHESLYLGDLRRSVAFPASRTNGPVERLPHRAQGSARTLRSQGRSCRKGKCRRHASRRGEADRNHHDSGTCPQSELGARRECG